MTSAEATSLVIGDEHSKGTASSSEPNGRHGGHAKPHSSRYMSWWSWHISALSLFTATCVLLHVAWSAASSHPLSGTLNAPTTLTSTSSSSTNPSTITPSTPLSAATTLARRPAFPMTNTAADQLSHMRAVTLPAPDARARTQLDNTISVGITNSNSAFPAPLLSTRGLLQQLRSRITTGQTPVKAFTLGSPSPPPDKANPLGTVAPKRGFTSAKPFFDALASSSR